MARYEIPEENFESLIKKLTHISNKCAKLGLPFNFKKLDDGHFVKRSSGRKCDGTYHEWAEKYYSIEVEGTAIVNNWKLIGSVEATPKGNLCTNFDIPDPDPKSKSKFEIPIRYWNGPVICEHCGQNRMRKKAYVVYNEETNEYKEIGSSCLAEFTHGLSAEYASAYESVHHELEQASSSSSATHYEDVENFLYIALQVVKQYGYLKVTDAKEYDDSSVSKVSLLYNYSHGNLEYRSREYDKIKAEKMISKYHFDLEMENENLKSELDSVYSFILSQDENSSSYIHNLQLLLKLGYFKPDQESFLTSAIPYAVKGIKYLKTKQEMARERELEQQKEKDAKYYDGKIGDRITISDLKSCTELSHWETVYGVTHLYKFMDGSHVFIWYASKSIDNVTFDTLAGTIKGFSEYNGVKQTVLSRCRLS